MERYRSKSLRYARAILEALRRPDVVLNCVFLFVISMASIFSPHLHEG